MVPPAVAGWTRIPSSEEIELTLGVDFGDRTWSTTADGEEVSALSLLTPPGDVYLAVEPQFADAVQNSPIGRGDARSVCPVVPVYRRQVVDRSLWKPELIGPDRNIRYRFHVRCCHLGDLSPVVVPVRNRSCDAVVAVGATSVTASLALICGAASVGLLGILALSNSVGPRRGSTIRWLTTMATILGVAVMIVWSGALTRLVGKDSPLGGRTIIWRFVVDSFESRWGRWVRIWVVLGRPSPSNRVHEPNGPQLGAEFA